MAIYKIYKHTYDVRGNSISNSNHDRASQIPVHCPRCNTTGAVNDPDSIGQLSAVGPCPDCMGAGVLIATVKQN